MSLIGNISDFYNGTKKIIDIDNYLDVTMHDLIALIQIIQTSDSANVLNIYKSMYDNIEDQGDGISVSMVPRRHVIAILYIISKGKKYFRYHKNIYNFGCDEILKFPPDDEKEFLDLAIKFGIINYDITRGLIQSLGVKYEPSTELGELYLKQYLDISNIKSSRSV